MNAIKTIIQTLSAESNLRIESPTPLYRRLQQGIRKSVEQGVIEVDQALPAERDLAQLLGVSRVTVRKAIKGLVESGYLVQHQGAGTFVAPRVEQPLLKLTGFTEDVKAHKMKPASIWLERATGTAIPDEAQALNLEPGAAVSRLYRIRCANDKPMCLEQATLPRWALPEPRSVEVSLYAELDKAGNRPVRAVQKLRAEIVDLEKARLLKVQPGMACLHFKRTSYLSDGSPIEYVLSYYRGDVYDFVIELRV